MINKVVSKNFIAIHQLVAYNFFMPNIESLFVTRLYHASLFDFAKSLNISELHDACLSIAEDDSAGQKWCFPNSILILK